MTFKIGTNNSIIYYCFFLFFSAFTVERYLAVCRPLQNPSISKRRRVVKVQIIIWFIAILSSTPYFYFTNRIDNHCMCDPIFRLYFTICFHVSAMCFFLLPAFILGILGSFHCVGMCGPIAFILPVDRKNSFNKVIQTFSYHFGRLLTYCLLGFVFGLLGKTINIFGFQQQLSILIGVLMIVFVLFPSRVINRYNFS